MNYRQYFPYPENLIFLNSGSMSLSPQEVIDKMTLYKKEYEQNPTAGLFGAWEKMWQVQQKLASYFKARPQDIYLRANVTYVMNDFIMALQLPKNSEILISTLEYGAVRKICEYKAKTEGHSVKEIDLYPPEQNPETVNDQIIIENIEKSLSPQTKLVMLSHVMTGTGLKIPIEKIANILRQKNIFFSVDGAHGAGCCKLNFSETQVDMYGTNLHKWLMGPKGTGFGWVSPRIREFLQPKFAGWTTGEIPPHFSVFGDGDHWTSRWMICSTHNFSDFYGISDTLDFWKKHDCQQIAQKQKELGDFTLKEISKATGWQALSSYPDSLRTPLIAFRLPEKLRAKGLPLMGELFNKHRLVISMPVTFNEWTLRLSPNIYNTHEEISQAADILGQIS